METETSVWFDVVIKLRKELARNTSKVEDTFLKEKISQGFNLNIDTA
jgi:hypothetical protein